MNLIEASVIERMGVSGLWELGFRGRGITVAVIDSGITLSPSFSGKIVCDMDFTGERHPRDDGYWHGTQVAECVHVVASEAEIANLRVVPSHSALTKNTVISAIQHCIDVYPQFRVINISLSFKRSGCPDNCPLCRKVDEAYRKGMLVMVAAGNEGPKVDTLTCPARANWATSNMATWTIGEKDFWKRIGRLRRFWYTHVTGEFGDQYGTSFSAGYWSGAAALLFSAFPKVDADTLRFAMLEVNEALRAEVGHHTTLKVERVYKYLVELRKWASIPGAVIEKNGALRPYLDPF